MPLQNTKGPKRRLTAQQETFVKQAIARMTPTSYGIDENEWNRAAIAQLIKNEWSVVLDVRTITDYRKRWGVISPEKLTPKGGRSTHQIPPAILTAIGELLELTALSASKLYAYLRGYPPFASVIGKKASFHNRLKEAGLRATMRTQPIARRLLDRFCLRIRLLILPLVGKDASVKRHVALLCGYETATGFANCYVYDIEPTLGGSDGAGASPTSAILLNTRAGSESPQVSFPVEEVTKFVENTFFRLGLPICNLDVTQLLSAQSDFATRLEATVQDFMAGPKTVGHFARERSTAIPAAVRITANQVKVLDPVTITFAQLQNGLRQSINLHNREIAGPVIAQLKADLKRLVPQRSQVQWNLNVSYSPRVERQKNDVKRLENFFELHPLNSGPVTEITCRPRKLDGFTIKS